MSFELTPLQNSLMSLSVVKRYLQDALKAAKASGMQDARDSLSCFLMICVHSFNQEWMRFEGLGKDPEIQKTLRLASPLVRRIRSWKAISQLRSSFLAHEPYDRQTNKIVDVRTLFGEGKAPSEFWEQMLLGECAVWAISIAISRHIDDQNDAISIVYKDGPHQIGSYGISSPEEFDQQMDQFREGLLDADNRLGAMFQAYKAVY